MFKDSTQQMWTGYSKAVFLAGLILLAAVTGCGGGGGGGEQPPPPTPPSIQVNLPKTSMEIGTTLQASVVITNLQDQTVNWSVDGDPAVATIDGTGLIHAGDKTGTCTIKAQSRSLTSLVGTTSLKVVVPLKILEFFPTKNWSPGLIALIASFTGGTGQIEGVPGVLAESSIVWTQVDTSRQFKLTVTSPTGDQITATTFVEVPTLPLPEITDLKINPILNKSANLFSVTAVFSGGTATINGNTVMSGVPTLLPTPESKIFRLIVQNGPLKEVREQRVGSIQPGLNFLAGFIDGPGNINGEARSARFGGYWAGGMRQMYSLSADQVGNIFIADGNPAIKMLTPSGQIQTFAGSLTESGSTDGPRETARFTLPTALATDEQGNLWCLDSNVLRVVRPNGQVETVLQNIAPSGLSVALGTSVDSIYWDKTTNSLMYPLNAQGRFGRVIVRYRIATGQIEIFCSDPDVIMPEGIVRSPHGSFLVVDSLNNAVFEIDDSGKATLAFQGGEVFLYPYAIVKDRNGEVFLSTSAGNNIYHLIKFGDKWLAVWMTGLTGNDSVAYADGSPRRAAMGNPRGIAFRGDKLIVADSSNHVLREMDAFGNLTTVAGEARPTTGWSPWGALSVADAVAVSPQDKILAVFRLGLERIGDDGTREVLIPDSGDIYHLPKDGPLGQGQWGGIYPALAFDLAGNMHIAVQFFGSNMLLRKMDPTGTLTTIGQYQFPNPFQICVAPNRDLVFADTSNSVIRRIKPNGVAEIIAGNVLTGRGYQDGPAAQAKFLAPVGATVDTDGTIYVSDWGNHVVRKISTDGIVSTVAGSQGNAGQLDGTGIGARFDLMHNIYIDKNGDLLVLENNCIRKVTKTGTVSTLVGSFKILGVKLGPLPASIGGSSSIGLLQNGDMVLCERDFYLLYLKN